MAPSQPFLGFSIIRCVKGHRAARRVVQIVRRRYALGHLVGTPMKSGGVGTGSEMVV